jgi:histidine kinase
MTLIGIIYLPQYHYRLGMALYTMTKGSNVDDIVFCMADQINYGINDAANQSLELRLNLANLNEMAGVKAVDCCDYVTARAYLNIALSFLPTNHWKSQYDQSLRLFFSLAKSAYACGDMEKAQEILHEILGECSCTEDTLQAYYLLVTSKYQHCCLILHRGRGF